jgi:membrane protease YdiL (CAAX protease family)
MQGFFLMFNSRWVSVILTSVIFASLHLANPEISQFGFYVMVPYYFLAGLFLALITVFDHGLELALGVHWATNFYGATMVTFAGGAIQTDALFTQNNVNATLMLLAFLIQATIFIIFCYKKYNWKFNLNLKPYNE